MVAVDLNIILLAGPNGAGKSTAAPDLLHGALHVDEFVNADVIARGLSAFNPGGAALDAGRVMLARLKELAAQKKTSPSNRRWPAGPSRHGFANSRRPDTDSISFTSGCRPRKCASTG
jgi:hypothetical protein